MGAHSGFLEAKRKPGKATEDGSGVTFVRPQKTTCLAGTTGELNDEENEKVKGLDDPTLDRSGSEGRQGGEKEDEDLFDELPEIDNDDMYEPTDPGEEKVREDTLEKGKARDEGREISDDLSQEEVTVETEEGRRAIHIKSPMMVSQEEEAHEKTHLPYRSWCKWCVWARSRNRQHKKKDKEDKHDGVPRVAMYYFFMSKEDEEACRNPCLVMKNEQTGERYARAVGQKGLGTEGEMDWQIKDISQDLESWACWRLGR